MTSPEQLTEAEREALRLASVRPFETGDLVSRDTWDAQTSLIDSGLLQICRDVKRRDYGRIWLTPAGRAVVDAIEAGQDG